MKARATAIAVLGIGTIVLVVALCASSRPSFPRGQEALTFAKAIFPLDTDTDYWVSRSSDRAHRHLVLRSDKPFDIKDKAHAMLLSAQFKAKLPPVSLLPKGHGNGDRGRGAQVH